MTRRFFLPAAACLFLAALLAAASCSKGSRHRVEVLSGPPGGKAVLRVAVSDEVIEIFRRITEGYASRHDIEIELFPTQSGDIPGLLRKGAVDMGISGRNVSSEAGASGIIYLPFAYDGAVFMAATDTGVRKLTSAQVGRIYAGQIANWKEVGGSDREIRTIGRPAHSSVRKAIETALGAPLPTHRSTLQIDTADSAFHAMKTVGNFLAYVPMSRTMLETFPGVALALDDREPLVSSVPRGSYPARLEYGILFARDAREGVADLANYMVSVDGIHQVASLGLVPAMGNTPVASCHCRGAEGTFTPSRQAALGGSFRITILPEMGAIEQEKRYAGISQIIANETGIRTQLVHLATYGDVLRAFEQGETDAAFVGSLMYGRLHTRVGVRAVARPEAGGSSHYHGVVVVRSDSPYRSFSDLKGKVLAVVPDTSAGELFASDLARREGAKLETFGSRLLKAPSHADAIRMVVAGKVDGCVAKDLVLHRMMEHSPEVRKKVRVLEASKEFPDNALVVSPSMDENRVAALKKILLALHTTETGRLALRALGAERFVETADRDYGNVYALARSAGYPMGKK